MIELLQFEFMRNALIAACLISIACGIVGSYVVIRKLTFIAGGIAHAAFGGIGIGYFLGLNPLLSAVPFSIFVAMVIGALKKKVKVSEDTAIGIIWALGMAIGILFIYITPGYAPDLFSYLFGNILTISSFDLIVMAFLNIAIVLFVILLFEELKSISFDEEFSEVVGVRTDILGISFLCMIAMSVVLLVKVVGIILVIALLTIPASIAKMYTHNLKKMMMLSFFLSLALIFAGLFASYQLNLPSGATIILISSTVFVLAYLHKISAKKEAFLCH